ncbi:MAG: hypothetical protein BGO12_21405 [Verrucomicrobia bacterium 61-8]|nr:hypothetical protein [Verrucomicrobiota bacterium]OJU98052.1 MAG: hypothetical protein BGO12_21405 [Verrucomicrobia bacterium 61-8]
MAATRREALEAVERLWDRYPEQRLGQLLTNIAIFARGPGGAEEVYDLENWEIVGAVVDHLGGE